MTPDLLRYTSSPTHANSTGLLQEASENRNEKKDGGKQERDGGAARMMENQRVGMEGWGGAREEDSAREREDP